MLNKGPLAESGDFSIQAGKATNKHESMTGPMVFKETKQA